MTNYEKYKDEIDRIWDSENDIGVTKDNEVKPCYEIRCNECIFDGRCVFKSQKWLVSEYKDPTEDVDWSKVPVDTPILVKDYEDDGWLKRYFAGIDDDGNVTTFDGGATSWTDNGERLITDWKHAKLANPDDLKNSELHQEKKYEDVELINMLTANYTKDPDDDEFFSQEAYRRLLNAVYCLWNSDMDNFNKEKIVRAIELMLEVE